MENKPLPMFHVLTGLLGLFEDHLRQKNKAKTGAKAEWLRQFFTVRQSWVLRWGGKVRQLTPRPLLKRWREDVGPDLYPVVRLMLPDVSYKAHLEWTRRHLTCDRSQRDNRRRNYSLKEQKLAKGLIKALDLPERSDAALKLSNWKVPTKDDVSSAVFVCVLVGAS
jgi:hypothetical protein